MKRDHVITIRTGPQGENARCGTCGVPVYWTAFAAGPVTDEQDPYDGVVAFIRHDAGRDRRRKDRRAAAA